jgi:protein-S-isoprenylcysteine O-methyltransferase Ste14
VTNWGSTSGGTRMRKMTSLPSLGPRGEGWVLIQGVLLVLVAAAGWTLGPDWSGPLRLIGIILGIALLAGGVILAVRGAVDLGRAMTPVPHPRDGAELVESGVYAFARHPIYGGLILGSVGWACMRASLVALAMTALLAGFLLLKSTREEAWLVEHYAGYAAYRQRTRRFIPWIG